MNNQLLIKTRKVIINKDKGLFDFSSEFYKKYKEIYKHEFNFTNQNDFQIRSNPKIIKVFELLGPSKSSCIFSDLKIIYIPEELMCYIKLTNKNGRDHIKINYNKN